MAACLQPWTWKPNYRDHDGTGKIADDIEGLRCHVCVNCRAVRRAAVVGRVLAESLTSVESRFVTRTYANDDRYRGSNEAHEHPHARTLVYKDMQDNWKRMRNDGHEFSYLVVGEYGTLHNRAHWHALEMFRNDPPPYRHGFRMGGDDHWSEGMVDYDSLNLATVEYVTQYILPDAETLIATHAARSTKMPLGDRYFRSQADLMIENGLSPQTAIYQLPNAFTMFGGRRGPLRNFYLVEGALDRFCDYYLNRNAELRPGRKYPGSDLLDIHVDRAFRRRIVQERRDLAKGVKSKPELWQQAWDADRVYSYASPPRELKFDWKSKERTARPTLGQLQEARKLEGLPPPVLTREQRLHNVLFEKRLKPDSHPLTSPRVTSSPKFKDNDPRGYAIVRST